MAQTFHEMLNTVRFRDIAGKVNSHDDLWALRDLLFQKMGYIQISLSDMADVLGWEGCPGMESALREHSKEICSMIERDIMTIETYCRKRGIMRTSS